MKQQQVLKVWGQSHHIKHKNSTVLWLPSDTEERYKKHIANKETKQLLELNGWLDKEITYSFNEYGYRCDSFNIPCEMLFVGCSQTIGVGISLDTFWASRVAEQLNVPYHNIACGGADWQHVAQRLCYWIPILKPKTVVLKEPPAERFNWWDQETVVTTCEFEVEELMSCKINESRPLIDIIDDNNSAWYQYSMLEFVKQQCKENGANLIVIPTGRLNTDVDYKKDLARDLSHFGKEEQNYSLNVALDKIKNEKYF